MTLYEFIKIKPGDLVYFQNSGQLNGVGVKVIEKTKDGIIYEHPVLYCRCTLPYTRFRVKPKKL